MATDREGKPMIEGRSDDRDHDEDPDDDDLWYGTCRSVLGIVLTLLMPFLAGTSAASTGLKMLNASNGETSILKSFSPGIDLAFLVRMSPWSARSLSTLVILAQHSCVMSRHFTSWCVSYVLQFFPFAFCDLCDRQSDPYFVP